jgi:hypothetical protein
LTIKRIYAKVSQSLKNKMNRQQAQKETKRLVNWCLEQSENLNDADGLALLNEFDEWIQYEADEIDDFEFVSIKTNNPK